MLAMQVAISDTPALHPPVVRPCTNDITCVVQSIAHKTNVGV